jgi:hypothetical protein
MDKIVSKIAALGVPGLVLIVAMSASGFAGAAALTVALSALGGPVGRLGGVAVLGLLLLLSQALTEYGFDAVFSAVVPSFWRKAQPRSRCSNKSPITQFQQI